MAGEEGTMMLSSNDFQARKVGITKRKAEETAMAGSGHGGLNEERLQVEVKPLTGSEVLRTSSSDCDISQPEELETLISNSSEPNESKTPSPNSSVSEESDADGCVSDEYFSQQWANMMAELGFEDSDFADYGELAAMDNQGVEETAVAGEKGCTSKRKESAGSGDGGLILKEEKLQVELKPMTGSEVLRTPSSDCDISQPDELETLISNSSEPDESKTPSPNSSVSEESDADDSEAEDQEEYFSEQWANMMAELGFEDSDFVNYGELAAMDKQGVDKAA